MNWKLTVQEKPELTEVNPHEENIKFSKPVLIDLGGGFSLLSRYQVVRLEAFWDEEENLTFEDWLDEYDNEYQEPVRWSYIED